MHNEPKTHIIIEAGDPKLAKRFNITENRWANQFATKNGIYIVFTRTINRTAGSDYQTNPAAIDSIPNYRDHEF